MIKFLPLLLVMFLFVPISQASSEPIVYFGTCNLYQGKYSPDKTPMDHLFLTTQGQVLPSWPFNFPGNPHNFRVRCNWGVYSIVDEDSPEKYVEQDTLHGQILDLRFEDPVSGTSLRCVKSNYP